MSHSEPTVGSFAAECAEKWHLPLVEDSGIASGLIQFVARGVIDVRQPGIYINPDAYERKLADQTVEVFDSTVKK